MKIFSIFLAGAFIALYSGYTAAQQSEALPAGLHFSSATSSRLIDPEGSTIHTRILAPEGYKRSPAAPGSFAHYLRTLPLKPHGARVHYYNGEVKNTNGVYVAVVDMDIGKRDLQQCADAIMRLRAEYLWGLQQWEQIHFNLTNGFRVDYTEWMEGKRVMVEGNKTWWKQTASRANTYEGFRKYLDFVFAYAGTLSLARELKPAVVQQLEIGDVFIQGGSPGHAVIVVDKAVNAVNGKVMFLLAQSYMPAQNIQILQNPTNRNISPWYEADFGDTLLTPEWSFGAADLKRFSND